MRCGQISVRNSAVPKDKGTAINKASREETTVPYMKGRAPKSSSTGFQILLKRNWKPNLLSESRDCEISSKRISPTTETRAMAHATTTARKAASATKVSLSLNRLLGTGAGTPEPLDAGREVTPFLSGESLPGRVFGTVYMAAR